MPPPRRVRTVLISDLHLGIPGCQAVALLDFLKQYPSEYLYLVGDIIDGWQLRKRWYWPQSHNDVIQKLLKRAPKAAKPFLCRATMMSLHVPLLGNSLAGSKSWNIRCTTLRTVAAFVSCMATVLKA